MSGLIQTVRTPDPRRALVTIIGICATVGVVIGLVFASTIQLKLLSLLVIPLLLRTFSGSRLRPLFLSPIKMFCWFMALVGVVGWLLFQPHVPIIGSDLVIDRAMAEAAVTVMLASSTYAAAGALVFVWTSPRPPSVALRPVVVPAEVRTLLLVGTLAPLAVYATINPTFLLERLTYSSGAQGSVLLGAARLLTMAAVVVLGYLFGAEGGGRRLLVALLGIMYWAILFAQGSRQFALAPLVFALGVLAARLDRQSTRRVGWALLLALVLVPVPVYLRGLSFHGLFPYLNALPGIFESDVDPLSGLANVLFSFPVTGITALQAIPPEAVAVEVNPLPGEAAGWYAIAQSMRVNEAVPFSGLGELAGAGAAILAVFWLLAGGFLAYLDRRIGQLLAAGVQAAALAMVGLGGMFVVIVSQYNLRNAVRLLLYAIILDLLVRMWQALKAPSRAAE